MTFMNASNVLVGAAHNATARAAVRRISSFVLITPTLSTPGRRLNSSTARSAVGEPRQLQPERDGQVLGSNRAHETRVIAEDALELAKRVLLVDEGIPFDQLRSPDRTLHRADLRVRRGNRHEHLGIDFSVREVFDVDLLHVIVRCRGRENQTDDPNNDHQCRYESHPHRDTLPHRSLAVARRTPRARAHAPDCPMGRRTVGQGWRARQGRSRCRRERGFGVTAIRG